MRFPIWGPGRKHFGTGIGPFQGCIQSVTEPPCPGGAYSNAGRPLFRVDSGGETFLLYPPALLYPLLSILSCCARAHLGTIYQH